MDTPENTPLPVDSALPADNEQSNAVEVNAEPSLMTTMVVANAAAQSASSAPAGNTALTEVKAPADAEDSALDADEDLLEDVQGIALPTYDNFQIDKNPLQPKTDKDVETGIEIHLRSANNAETNAAWASKPNTKVEASGPGRDWKESLERSYWTTPRSDWFTNTIARSGALFMQTIPSERGPLGVGAPTIRDDATTRLTGEKAVIHMRAVMNMGNLRRFPLWHTGIWLTVKAPSESRILELERRIADDKVELGRTTHGLAFANQSVFFAGLLVDFVIEHIHSSSLKQDDPDYHEIISCLDIPLMVWGIACAIWPNGFDYARAKLNKTEVVRGKVDVTKLLATDFRSLSEWQISHMAGKHGRNMTPESLVRYREEFTRGKNKAIALTDSVTINLRTPSVAQYLASGEKWVNGVIAMVDKSFGMTANDDLRNAYITAQGKASNMRQFIHWVESIQVAGQLYDDEDSDTMELLLDTLSSEDAARKAYFKEMQSYIEEATVSLPAIPASDDDELPDANPKFKKLLPLDMFAVFFILLVQVATKIRERS